MNHDVSDQMVRKLRELNRTSEAARRFFEIAAARQYDSTETKVDRAAGLAHVTYNDMKQVFQQLAAIGVATYVKGTRGHDSRLKWERSLRSVGKAASGAGEAISAIDVGELDDDDALNDAWDEGLTSEDEGLIRHQMQLRQDFKLSLDLPLDLTGKEAQRIATWVTSLPFDD